MLELDENKRVELEELFSYSEKLCVDRKIKISDRLYSLYETYEKAPEPQKEEPKVEEE